MEGCGDYFKDQRVIPLRSLLSMNYHLISCYFDFVAEIDGCYHGRCEPQNVAIGDKKPEGFIIHCLPLNYTSKMEKAMLAAHGVCYEVYKRNHKIRMNVEKRRELEYLKSQQMSAAIERKIHG